MTDTFWPKVDRGQPTECWLWKGATTRPGWHGRFLDPRSGQLIMAHRYAWEITFGPISAGLSVLHACDVPACVNPGHLMLGTLQANSVDAGRKGRLGVGKYATHCKRGHPFAGNTYIHPVTGRRLCHECIRLRGKARPPRVKRGAHFAQPDANGQCVACGERLLYGPMGGGRVGWRHSRWAQAVA